LIIDNSHDLGMDHRMDQNFRRYLVDHRKGQLKKETPLSMSKAPLKEKPNIIGKVLGGIAGSRISHSGRVIQKFAHGMLLVSDNRRQSCWSRGFK
jgi:hypothetical protein